MKYNSVICTVCFIAFAVAFYVYFTNSDSDAKTQAEKDHYSRNRTISVIVMVLAAVGLGYCWMNRGRKMFAKMDYGVVSQCNSTVGRRKGHCRHYDVNGNRTGYQHPSMSAANCLKRCNRSSNCNSCSVDAE